MLYEVITSTRFLSRENVVWVNISSKVIYSLIVDGDTVASDSYIVKEGGVSRYTTPLVYAFIYDALIDPSIMEETFGLGPHGWVIGGGESVRVMIIAIDDSSKPMLRFEYRVGDGSWTPAPISDSLAMEKLYNLTISINSNIKSIEDWIRQYYSIEIPRSIPTIRIAEAVIPPQNPGTYVMFRAIATDVDGNTMVSPIGMYYVVNKSSDTRILVIDPHILLWLSIENLRSITNISKSVYSYGIPDDISRPIAYIKSISGSVERYGIVSFHHWEYLGKYYNIYIAWPKSDVANLLNTFKPSVIILSSLGLGLQGGGIWNWDLRDIHADGRSLLDTLASYIKTSHAGLIATHATLSDWIVWTSCGERVKIGARGHIGYNLSDMDILNERTVAALLGMPELALWEYVRDAIAMAICIEQPEIGMLIGSIPLQVPHIPWNGVLRLTPEAKDLGWDLPQEFTVEMSTLLKEYGFRAYTEVGWQFALPRALAYVAWNSSYEAREHFAVLRDRLSMLIGNITGGVVDEAKLKSHLDRGLEGGLRDFYRSLNAARIRGSTFNISIPIGVGRSMNISIDVGKEALLNILQRMPVKIVALSPNGLAGIVVHDKFWDLNGYRAVYFSFEVEAVSGDIAEKLLVNAVEWVRKWQFRDVTELLGGVLRVPKDVATRFRDVVATLQGKEVFSDGLILNEEGGAEIKLSLSTGRLYIAIAHPTSNVYIDIAKGDAKIVNITRISDTVTKIVVDVEKSGDVVLLLKAGSEASLNSIYVTIKFEAYATTTSPTTTTTPVTTTTTTITTTAITTTMFPTTTPLTTTITSPTATTPPSPTTTPVSKTTVTSTTTPTTATTSISTYLPSSSPTPTTQTTPSIQLGTVLVVVGVIAVVIAIAVILMHRKR